MTTEQFEQLLEILGRTDWLSIVLNIAPLVIAIWSIERTRKDSLSQLAFDRRLDVYAELGHYLQLVTANHHNAKELRNEIFSLITKTYFFASQPISDLFQDFIAEGIYDKEIELIEEQGENRSKDFNEFDAYIFTLIKCMKEEAKKGKDLTVREVEAIREGEYQEIGNNFRKK